MTSRTDKIVNRSVELCYSSAKNRICTLILPLCFYLSSKLPSTVLQSILGKSKYLFSVASKIHLCRDKINVSCNRSETEECKQCLCCLLCGNELYQSYWYRFYKTKVNGWIIQMIAVWLSVTDMFEYLIFWLQKQFSLLRPSKMFILAWKNKQQQQQKISFKFMKRI